MANTYPPYDPKKAELWNKLRQQGFSEDDATAQAGITSSETENYAIGMNGQMGAFVVGFPASGRQVTAGDIAQVSYDETASAQPSSKTPVTYTTTSTTEVSGGGSTTIIDNPPNPTAASRALQPAIDAKQAEIEQFNRDNPSNFLRKKQGLPVLTPEENQQRSAQALALAQQKQALTEQQDSAKEPVPSTIVTVPNTTTTTTTVTTGNASVGAPVQSPGGADPVINQQTEINIGTTIGTDNKNTNPLTPAPAVDPQSGLTTASAEQLGAAYGYTAPAPVQGSIATDTTDPLGIGRQAASVEPANDGYGGASQAEADAINQAIKDRQQAQDQAGGGMASSAENDAINAALAGAQQAKQQQALAEQQRGVNNADWRVKISLAPNAQYLYNDPSNTLLAPLKLTSGVLFPYTPKIDTSYHAGYQSYDLTHSNYRGYFYKNSYVDAVNLSCTFTAQNTSEANYLLAVIHFFKSVTKMFYGQDQENRGSPPPMVFITGLGEYQFSKHPCVVTEFRYNLPSDVDYIRAGSPNQGGSTFNLKGLGALTNNPFVSALIPPSIKRLGSSPLVNLITGGAAGQLLGVTGIPKGAIQNTPSPPTIALNSPTYVPTKMDITLSLLPMQSRNQVSTQFNVKDFANGRLLKGGFW